MDKAVLISIQPKWCELIASGKKTVEVRKTKPKIETPFKVYIYMTASYASYPVTVGGYPMTMHNCGGKDVIGEFVCNHIDTYDEDTIHAFSTEDYSEWNDFDLYNSCIHPEDIERYANDNWLYGWHISDLVIYDKPKELSEFIRICPEWEKDKITDKCLKCEHYFINRAECIAGCDCEGELPITRPPQSWCYVENHSSSF